MYSVTIQIDRESSVPLRTQIANAYAEAIRHGSLVAGQALPSVRALSGRLGISPLTVAAAYRELCSAGLASARPRSGFRVDPVCAPAAAPGLPRTTFLLNRLEPDLRIAPVAQFAQLVAELAAADASLGAYADFRGDLALREAVAQFDGGDRGAGIVIEPRRGVLITSGAQQAISLLARVLGAGVCVAVEDPCYPGARLAFSAVGAQVVGVPVGDDGPDDTVLRELLRTHKIAAFYCCPTYANPTGRTWSLAARRRVLEAAQQGGFLVVEDDYLGDLDYLDESPQRLAALAGDYPGARVLRIRTFSKTLLPALRLAAVSADAQLIERLLVHKTGDDLGCSLFLQRALAEFLRGGAYRAHLERVRPRYRELRGVLRAALNRGVPGLAFDDPPAGFCLLGRVAPGIGLHAFVAECAKRGVTISPGSDYWLDRGDGDAVFRIAFSALAPDEVAPVVDVLAAAAAAAGAPAPDGSLI